MASMSEHSRKIYRASDIRPGMIFAAKITLPHINDIMKPRPYLAINKITDNQIIALPLTSLEKKANSNETYKEICDRHQRSEWDYYPISPNTNIYNNSISQPSSSKGFYSKGWIDLITPMTIGPANIVTSRLVDEISQSDLEKVIAAHVDLVGFPNPCRGCSGVGASVLAMSKKIQRILIITKDLLQDSENKDSTQKKNESCFKEMISICNDPDETLPPSPPHEEIISPEIPVEIDPLPPRAAPRRRRRRNAKSSVTCNDGQLEIRRTDDPNGGGGPSGSGPNGGGYFTPFSTENNTRCGNGKGKEKKSSTQSGGSVHGANQNSVLEWTAEDWERIALEDQDGDDESNSTEEILGETWQLLDYDLSYCSSESDSDASSSVPEGLDVESWRESLPDPTLLDAQIREEETSDSRAQESPDKAYFTSDERLQPGCITSPLEIDHSEKPFARTESSSFGKHSLLDKTLKGPQKAVTTLDVTCLECTKTITIKTPGSESSIEAFCEKCNTSTNEDGVRGKYRIMRAFGEGFDKLILKNILQTGLANNWCSGPVKQLLIQASRKERNLLAESCSQSSPFKYVLREERIDGEEGDKTGNCAIVHGCRSVLEGELDGDILCFLGEEGYVDLSKGEYGDEFPSIKDDTETKHLNLAYFSLAGVTHQARPIPSSNTIGRQSEIGNPCQLLEGSNILKSFGPGDHNQSRVQQLTEYATAIQRRCDYLLRLINPAQKSLPPVHTIAKRLLEYVYSIKEITRAGRWKDPDCLEILPCDMLPKEYLPANSDVLINLLRSYPLTDGDSGIQALARLSLTNDCDLLLERINFALPRSHDDWLVTDNVWNEEIVQATSKKRLLLQQDGMIKWIRFLMSTLGLGETHTQELTEEEGSSKIEKDLLRLLDSLGTKFELAVESERVEGEGQGRIVSTEDSEEDLLEERDKKLKCENERCRRCMKKESGVFPPV